MIDSRISAKMVTAEGDRIEVPKNSYSDLFWALRRAGTNFGIVTSAVFKLSQLVNNGDVFYADLIYDSAQNLNYFNALQKFNNKIPS